MGKKHKPFFKTLWRQRTLVLMALPAIIMVFIFRYIPMYGILIAFKNFKSAKGGTRKQLVESCL